MTKKELELKVQELEKRIKKLEPLTSPQLSTITIDINKMSSGTTTNVDFPPYPITTYTLNNA